MLGVPRVISLPREVTVKYQSFSYALELASVGFAYLALRNVALADLAVVHSQQSLLREYFQGFEVLPQR